MGEAAGLLPRPLQVAVDQPLSPPHRTVFDLGRRASIQFQRAGLPTRIGAMKLIATSSAQRRGGESGEIEKERDMKPHGDGRKEIQGDGGQGTDKRPNSRIRMIAVAIGFAVLLVDGASTLPQLDADLANDAVMEPAAETSAEPTPFVYFPAQYVNQATQVEGHIEAF